MKFFVGLHHPHVAGNFDCCFISVNALRRRRGPFPANDWIMDSGAFTTIAKHGYYPDSPSEYAAQIRRWKGNGNLLAAVSQDYMCEPAMLAKTGLTIAEHQRLTVERYQALVAENTGVYIMPVLQGYAPNDYVEHLALYSAYGAELPRNAWVGVGSVCKRNGNPGAIFRVLSAIKAARPDLQLHGFGLKTTSLREYAIRDLLATADSMAWSFRARIEGRNGNDWREAKRFAEAIATAERPLAGLFA